MNETSATSSSSAAAVADSASAAADSKSATAATTAAAAAAATAATATSVKLLIKASNQQYEDQIIESDMLWSVWRLKKQLSLVYPSKPPIAEQKLIYSGQLLNDTLLLKDVIRSYKDVHTQNHIFHLVCATKHMLPTTNLSNKPKVVTAATMNPGINATTATDGLRYRNVAGSVQQQQQQQPLPTQQQQSLNAHTNNTFNTQFIPQMLPATAVNHTAQCPHQNPNMMPFSLPGQFNMQSMATQQAAMYNWMQQVYSQYMDQCIRFSNSTAGLPQLSPTGTPTDANMPPLNANFPAHPFLQQMPFMSGAHMPAANFASFAGASSVATGTANHPVIQFPNSATSQAAVATATVSAQAPQPAAAAEQPPAGAGDQQAAQLQRFPNIAQNEQENNDWLDSFFSLIRLAIFLTILFLNTSPLRCLIVVIIAGGIYLYHIGVFRTRAERNNNNINRNNNAADAANQIRQGVQEVQQAQALQQQQQEQPQENPPIAEEEQLEEMPPAEPANNTNASSTAEHSLASADTVAADENNAEDNQTSVFSFIQTFVVSFFTSLLPETPAL